MTKSRSFWASILPDDGSENSELTDALDHHDLLPGPDHVVRQHGRLDHLHQDVSFALVRIFDGLQERPNF